MADDKVTLLRSLVVFVFIGALCAAPLALSKDRQAVAHATDAVVVELEAPSAAELVRASQVLGADERSIAAQAQRQIASIKAAQQRVRGSLAGMQATVLYSTQRVYNGIAVTIDPVHLGRVAALPGVKAVHQLLPKRLSINGSVPLVGAPALWGGLSETGQGIDIAIIDTGIDYIHTNFGGSGVYTDVTDTSPFGATAKITGGYDFVGDAYTGENTPVPDANPIDCRSQLGGGGHGTHVAGIAAGYGVNGNGTTYTGPWDSSTPIQTLRIGPGVAPEANLIALRVFGCSGSSLVVDQAIEWAVDPNGDGSFDDRVDVINLSLGTDYGETYDSTAIAAERATELGVIVVAAAGNSGDNHSITSSPATAESVISVAASTDTDVIAGFSSRGPGRTGTLKPDIAAPGVSILSADNNTGDQTLTLSGTSMAAPHVAGGMALLRKIHPDWSVQQLKALVMNGAFDRLTIDLLPQSSLVGPARAGAGRLDLPRAAQLELLAFDSESPDLVSVSFGDVEVVSPTTITRTVTLLNKGSVTETLSLAYAPVTTIPGVTYRIEPARATLAAGASTQVAVILTALPDTMRRVIDPTMQRTQGGRARFFISEASGALLATRAAGAQRFWADLRGYYENPQILSPFSARATVDFTEGTRELSYTITFNTPITLSSSGGHLRSGAAGSNGEIVISLPGTHDATVSSLSGNVTLPATSVEQLRRGELYFNVHTSANPEGELRGQLVPADPILRLPIYATARPASAMRASLTTNWGTGSSMSVTATLTLEGNGLTASDQPDNVASLASVLELAYTHPPGPISPSPSDYVNFKHIGVGSTIAAAGTVANSTILFGITTTQEWASANLFSIQVIIDTNEDGIADYRLFTTSDSPLHPNDTGRTRLNKLLPDGSIDNSVGTIDGYPINILDPATVDMQPYNTNALVIAVDASDLGLSAANSSFRYSVTSETAFEDLTVNERSPLLQYDLARPGIVLPTEVEDLPIFFDVSEAAPVLLQFNRADAIRNRTQGILVIHHHNIRGLQVQAFTLTSVALPLVLVK